MAGLRRQAVPDQPTRVSVPQRLKAPTLTDFVSDEEVQAHGWPSGPPSEVRRHRLVVLAEPRWRMEYQRWTRELKQRHECADDLQWTRSARVGNVVPLP